MKHTVTLNLYESTDPWDYGRKQVNTVDFRDMPEIMDGKVWIGCQEVTIEWPEIDTTQMQIDALEAQVQKELADSQVRVNLLLERISKLKCLEHKE